MDTKLKADIAEHAVIARLLKLGLKVLKPIGDRLPYDLAVDLDGRLIRIQVKSAWKQNGAFIVDSRRTKTNRRLMVRSRYQEGDFDFAVLYIQELDVCYVMPCYDFNQFKSGISLVEDKTRQRSPKSAAFREAWGLLTSVKKDDSIEKKLSEDHKMRAHYDFSKIKSRKNPYAKTLKASTLLAGLRDSTSQA
jgi:hypothetical protein